jgi:hypothetical protein
MSDDHTSAPLTHRRRRLVLPLLDTEEELVSVLQEASRATRGGASDVVDHVLRKNDLSDALAERMLKDGILFLRW